MFKLFVRAALAFAPIMFAQIAWAQQSSFVHRLGRDTIAIEQFARSAGRIVGEVASRGGTAVTRLQYEVTLDGDGNPTHAIYRTRSAAGTPIANQPVEVRLTFSADSVRREAVFADSTNVRVIAAANAIPFQAPAYSMYETALARMRKSNAQSVAIALVNSGGGNPNTVTLRAGGGDTIRTSTGGVLRADRTGKLLSLDFTSTTQKLVSTRAGGGLDIASIASGMRPVGVLSARGNARASFLQSVVFVDYGRPQVRERTVWGGLLVPFDTIWRAGANEATHLATSRALTFGSIVVPPGLYTLWIYNSRTDGPQLVVSKHIGQWGAGPTSYNQANDLGRIPMTLANTPAHVEEYTITIRAAGQGRGALDFAWGDKVATAAFTVSP